MTGRIATTSMDGTPISQADIARIEEEERLHAEQQRKAALVVAAASTDVGECRMLLDMLGLDEPVIRAARADLAPRASGSRRRSRAA